MIEIGTIRDVMPADFETDIRALARDQGVDEEQLVDVVVSAMTRFVKGVLTKAADQCRGHAIYEAYMGGCKEPGCFGCRLMKGAS